MWTLFIQGNIQQFTHIDDIVEYTIRLLKHSVRILGRKFDNYLVPLLQLVIKAYEVIDLYLHSLAKPNPWIHLRSGVLLGGVQSDQKLRADILGGLQSPYQQDCSDPNFSHRVLKQP